LSVENFPRTASLFTWYKLLLILFEMSEFEGKKNNRNEKKEVEDEIVCIKRNRIINERKIYKIL